MNNKHTELFTHILKGNLKESERIFEKINIEEKIDSEWKEGYHKALEGLLLTLRPNSEKYLFFTKKFSEDNIIKLQKEFKAHTENSLHAEFDRGYFSALLDYLITLENNKPWKK
ncbi:hypothetical protein [[Eubacterium] cellulosolvens]